MSELKPCPFCGTNPCYEQIEDCGYVNCSNQNCISNVYCLSEKQWNTRPIEDELRAEIARLKEDNEKWRQLLKTQTSIFRDLTDKIEKLKEDAEMKLE